MCLLVVEKINVVSLDLRSQCRLQALYASNSTLSVLKVADIMFIKVMKLDFTHISTIHIRCMPELARLDVEGSYIKFLDTR